MKRRICSTPARRSSASTESAGSQDWGSPTVNAAAGTLGAAVIEVSQSSPPAPGTVRGVRQHCSKSKGERNRQRSTEENSKSVLVAVVPVVFLSAKKVPDA